MEKTDLVIIGAGPGGYVAAIRAAQLGKKVILIEENKAGGICLNYGCIPSKAMIYAADFLDKIKKSSSMGITTSEVLIDFQKMQSWKNSILSKLEKGVETLCNGNKITLIKGRASFVSSHSISVETKEGKNEINFENAIIATGSMPIEIPLFPFDEKTIVSSTGALFLEEIIY
ncbi:MAG: FAD-dependent oxidoreductase [Planctomycetota bacterium]